MTDLSISATIHEQEGQTGDVPLAIAHPSEHKIGSRPFWSEAELALLRRYYPDLGAAGLAPYLPARTVQAITETARKAGLHYNAPYRQQPPPTAQLDAAIRRLYRNGVLESGQMAKFCRQWNRPRQWVRMRAIQLGVCQPRRFGGHWRPEEDAILEAHEGRGTRYVQVKLMAAGYLGRTQPAIAQRMKTLALAIRDGADIYTAQEVGRLLGLEVHIPLGWIKAGRLKAKRQTVVGSVREVAMNTPILTASHYGVVHFGDLDCEAVVLTTGERGYVRKELAKLLGFHENNTGHRFRQILADYAPNSLSELDKFDSPICLPNGRRAQFFPAGVITMIASGVIDAALSRTLHRARQKLVPNCGPVIPTTARWLGKSEGPTCERS